MSDQWLTYADAANTLGMSVEGLRQRARREQWRRQIANDGKALVLVPGDATRRPAVETSGDQPNDKPATRRSPAAPPAGEVESLLERVRELRADLDRERTERTQERDRADHLAKELAEAGRRMAAIVGDVKLSERAAAEAEQRASMTEAARLADRTAAEARTEAIRAELEAIIERQTMAIDQQNQYLEAFKARPWWKRLAG